MLHYYLGTERFRKYWVDSFKETHVVVFVIDSMSPYYLLCLRKYLYLFIYVIIGALPSRFDEVNAELQKVIQHPYLINAAFCVLAHKQDLPTATPVEELRDHFAPILGALPMWHVEGSACSSNSRFGLEQMLRWICSLDLRARDEFVELHKNDPDPD